MSDDITGHLYLCFDTTEAAQRFAFYMNTDTRPDFPDDVPEHEAPLVDLFDYMPDCDDMDWPSANECVLYFEEDAFEAKELFPRILPHFSVKLALWCEDGFEYCHYMRFDGEYFDFLYSPEPLEDEDDDKNHNRQLSNAQMDAVGKGAEKGAEHALLALGRALIHDNT
jgi:hypothetical protein